MAITRDLTFATIYTDQGIELGDTLTYTTLNDGTTSLTATVAELNTLDGITATTAELNYVDGVTSNLQTQLNAKIEGNQTITLSGDVSGSGTTSIAVTIADDSHNHIISNVDGLQSALDLKSPLASPTFTGTLTYATLNDGTTALTSTVAELNTLDGITATVTELNYTDGVTSNIQTQLDAKAPLASPTFTGTPLAPTAAAATNTTQIATTAFVQTAVSNLVDAAPSTLDTLNELAAALGDDANFSTTVTNSIATKVPLAGGTMTGALNFGDSVKAQFGASQDLQIYHDGSNSYVQDSGTGNLNLKGTNLALQSSTGTLLYGFDSGAVNIYYNNALKLATTSTGIDVTGTVTADGLTVEGTDLTVNVKATNASATSVSSILFNNIDGNSSARDVVKIKGETGGNGGYGNFIVQTAFNNTLQDRLKADFNGDISFYDSTGTSQNLFWDASASRLGIGTTSPTSTLHVNSEISVGADADNRSMFGYTSDRFYLGTRQSATNYFDTLNVTSGNVGIGTTSPGTILHLAGAGEGLYISRANGQSPHIRTRHQNSAIGSQTASNDGNRVGQLSFEPYTSSSGWLEMTGIFGVVNGTVTSTAAPVDLVLSAGSSGNIASNEKMRITSGGNVGIGTTSPTEKLDVVGNAKISGTLTVNGSAVGSAMFPDYNQSQDNATRSANTWYQAAQDSFVTIYARGSYMNNYTVRAGTSTSSYAEIGTGGNDYNSNTWGMSFSFMIKKDSYFYVQSPSWSWASYAFEDLNIVQWW